MTARDLFPEIEVKTCGTCSNSSRPKNGYIRCFLLPKWQMLAETSGCQINPIAWAPLAPHAGAKRDAQAGIDQAVDAAERALEGWSEIAFRFVGNFAASMRGQQFIGHDIVAASAVVGIEQPPNPKAWGGPIQRAAREGLIKRVGFAPDPNRHTNPVPLWETV